MVSSSLRRNGVSKYRSKAIVLVLILCGLPWSKSFHMQTVTARTFSPTQSASRIRRPILESPSRLRMSSAKSSIPEESDVPKETGGYRWTPKTMELAVPALIGMLADPLLSLIDTAYVGHIGTNELAALGACTSIFHLTFNTFQATTAATTSLVAHASTDEEKREIVNTSLAFGIVLGIIVMTVLELSGPWCLGTMGVSRESPLFKPGIAYLRTRLYAAPAVLAIVVSEGAFRGFGDTKIPLLASVIASIINLVLDPILMFPLGFGVAGAAASTVLSQLAAALTYLFFLRKRQMLPKRSATSVVNRTEIIKTIMSANAAMVLKQGSLLLAWAYATARATRIGSAHVAAHQVALSCWLVSALFLDGVAVAAQVLFSRCMGHVKKMKSLVSYMLKFAGAQGLGTTLLLLAVAPVLPGVFTNDKTILKHLHSLMPQLAWQQLLVSLTLVTESLAVGGHQFRLLAVGTTISTFISMWQLRHATDVVSIWSKGIVSLFVGRLVTALIGTFRVLWEQKKMEKRTS